MHRRTLLLRLWLRVQQYTMNIFHRLITRLNRNKTYIFSLRNNMFCTPKTCGLKLGDLRFSLGTVLYNKLFRPASNLLCCWHFRCLSRMINDGKFIGAFHLTVFSVENLLQTREFEIRIMYNPTTAGSNWVKDQRLASLLNTLEIIPIQCSESLISDNYATIDS